MKASHKTMALWAVLLVISVLMFQMYETQKKEVIQNFQFSQFEEALKKEQVKEVSFRAGPSAGIGKILGEIKPEFKDEAPFNGATKFQITGNIGDEGLKIVRSYGITPNYESTDNSMIASALLNWLPLLLIVGLFFFLFKQLQSGGSKAMSFGKSKAKLLTENKHKVTFDDVAGVEEAKNDLEEIVHFLKDSKKFTRLGGRIPKGVLLVGPPGTGKTLLARAVAGEANVPFFTISGSDFVEMFVGVGASRVRDLFEQGKKHAPCLIFIDEIDAVGRHRGAGMGGGHDEREQTLNQLLVEMDGFEENEGVIIVAATNRPDVLDPALLRPGRFDRRVMVSAPDMVGREAILKVHSKKTPLASDVDINKVARGTPGFSGADLENLVNESALLAARSNKHKIEMIDFEAAKDKILMGSERRSMMMSDEDKKVTAYHEAGHTLIGKTLEGLDPIHKVTIIPRGMALGVTQTLPVDDQISLKKSKAKNMLAFLFGGRAAERVIFKDYTTGASNDIERATDIARKMVCEWGMSDKIGPMAIDKSEGPVFLGMQQSSRQRDYSDSKAEEIDNEIRGFINEGYELAEKILTEKVDILHALSKALLEYETIDSEEIDLLCKGGTVDEIKNIREAKEKELALEQKKAQSAAKTKDKSSGSGVPDPVTA